MCGFPEFDGRLSLVHKLGEHFADVALDFVLGPSHVFGGRDDDVQLFLSSATAVGRGRARLLADRDGRTGAAGTAGYGGARDG